MNLKEFLQKRDKQQNEKKQYRKLCTTCLQPSFTCFCSYIKEFDPKIKFVILQHPIEAKRRIATGRMSFLALKNAELIVEHDFTYCKRVQELLKNENYQSFVLYPGTNSFNLSHAEPEQMQILLQKQKIPLIFVIDGTWATARKMMRLSENIKKLPRLCFTPPAPSRFRVRKQPKVECYSTVEAIHHTINLLAAHLELDLNENPHDNLLYVFDQMVEKQIGFVNAAIDNPHSTSYRKPRQRIA